MESIAHCTTCSNSFMLTRMGELKRVVVVGAGTMGSQIALQTALSGRYDVTLVDSVHGQLERAKAQNQKLVDRSVEKGRLTAEQAKAAMERIRESDSLAGPAADADIVIEAVIEDFDAKKGVFTELGKHAAKDAILTSNSSTIAISRLADHSGRPERCCNTHFFHPVTVMQLCEVARGPKTSDETVAFAMDFVRSIDRTPVLLRKEIWASSSTASCLRPRRRRSGCSRAVTRAQRTSTSRCRRGSTGRWALSTCSTSAASTSSMAR